MIVYELRQQLQTRVHSILEIPATDEIHMEDRNHGLAWAKPNSGKYNTQNSQRTCG